jgi:SAM-dependent methyltransferase
VPAASNVDWERWGDDDPFYGVAAWPGHERGGATPWTAEAFYALGRSDWEDFRRRWVGYGLSLGRCVEIGCGAGRMTLPMADDFAEVIGVDVSDGMLGVAREHVRRSNVDLRLGDGITLPVDCADAVFSTHVFQHLESLTLAQANFAEAARVLVPGGTMMIHLPVYLPPTGLPGFGALLGLRKRVGDVRATIQRRRGRAVMRGLQYPWPWLLRELTALSFVDIELIAFPVRSNGAHHTCVLARKAQAVVRPDASEAGRPAAAA